MGALSKFTLCCLLPTDRDVIAEEQTLPKVSPEAGGRCREICLDLLCFCSVNNGFFTAVCASLSLIALRSMW